MSKRKQEQSTEALTEYHNNDLLARMPLSFQILARFAEERVATDVNSPKVEARIKHQQRG